MARQYDVLDRLQTQGSTGKKLLASSDDPFLADRIKSTENYLNQLKSYDFNLKLAEGINNDKNTVATQSLELVRKSQDLLLQSQNEVLSNNDRAVIAKELEGVLSQLLAQANARDAHGEYIYSGINVGKPPYIVQGEAYVYQGSSESKYIEIGRDVRINYTNSGYDIFGAIPNGNGILYATSNPASNTGTGLISDCSVTNNSHYVADQYTISLVTNSQGQMAYVINGTSTGQVIPQPPLNNPADAPAYVPGEAIAFNGISFLLSGQPESGDSFTVVPSTKQDVFTTLHSMINALNTPVNSPREQANLKQQLINFSDSLHQAGINFQSYETSVGNEGNIIDNQKTISQNLIMDEEGILSRLSDADMFTVLSDLTRQMAIVKLTQETYMKIQESLGSLFMNNN